MFRELELAILEYLITTETYDRQCPGYWYREDHWLPRFDYLYQCTRFAKKKEEELLTRFQLSRREKNRLINKMPKKLGEQITLFNNMKDSE